MNNNIENIDLSFDKLSIYNFSCNICHKKYENELNYYKHRDQHLTDLITQYNKDVDKTTQTTQNLKLEISCQDTISIRPTTSWDTYILHAHKRMIHNKNTKEIGKLRANAAEYVIVDWLNTFLQQHGYWATWIAIHAEDEKQCREFKLEGSDPNSSGFDIYLLNKVLHEYKRIQVKYRNSDFHFETTRRNSKKNENKNTTGHVVYSADEFDILIGVCTFNNLSNKLPTSNNISIIDINILKDPNNPENLISKITNKTRDICITNNENYLHKILCNSKELILPQILSEIRLENFSKDSLHCCCKLLKIEYGKKEIMDILRNKIQKQCKSDCYNTVIKSVYRTVNRSKIFIKNNLDKVDGKQICFWITPEDYVCYVYAIKKDEQVVKEIIEWDNNSFCNQEQKEKYKKYKKYNKYLKNIKNIEKIN